MDDRLVWLPFDVAELSDGAAPDWRPPGSLRFGVYAGGEPSPTIRDVAFWNPPYGTRGDWPGLFARMSSLEVVQTPSAGVDHLLAHVPAGVTLCNGRGIHDDATAEWAVALLLAGLRGLPDFVEGQQREEWRHDTTRRSLADARVVVVGFGSIGQALARRLDAFGCDVVPVASRSREGVHGADELPTLLPDADAVVLLTPLTERTRGLAGADFLARMRDGALLVNVARGAVVDTDALLAENGRVLAALDVTDPEPLPAGHPLWSAPGVLVTPHVAGGTTAMKPRLQALLRDQLDAFAAGGPLRNVV